MSQAAIIEGNRFILWAQRQDIDGWWKLQAGMQQVSKWELSSVEMVSQEIGSKWPLCNIAAEAAQGPLLGREVARRYC